ncbi:MAG TPA: O-antigen ligase family protein, partial [Vicinamibacteria bacterium]|nr:O-antigen ligase family protein [Vicinamibacteria bacterium]
TFVLLLSFGAGLGSWWLARGGSQPVPAARWLLGFLALVLFQLVPLPPFLLRLLSPGSYHLYTADLLAPSGAWHPVSVSPPRTAFALVQFAGKCLLFAAVLREFRDERWRRRLAWSLVSTALFLALEGLYQAASATPLKIYTIFSMPEEQEWAVFGAFSGRNQFAGYMVMMAPLSFGFAAEAWQDVIREWKRRPRGWLVLGESPGSRALWRSAVAMVLAVGVFAPQSRGGLAAFVLSALLLPLAFRQRLRVLALVGFLVLAGAAWVDFGGVVHGFESRGFRASRIDLWLDAGRMVPDFPLFGVGFGAFGPVYLYYQTFSRGLGFWNTHNDYLQIVTDTGVLGLVLAIGGFWTILRRGFRAASQSALDAGMLAALLGSMCHVFVDFDWQMPANALTFIAL